MKSNYWMKLYFEILHDAKMARLNDRQWRRTIELFLLVGENGSDGALPSIDDMAWQLRISVKTLEADLLKIAELGIVNQDANGIWFVTNFAKRNDAVTGTERIRNYRETKGNAEYQSPVTNRYISGNEIGNESVTDRYTDKNREDKNKIREESDEKNAAHSAFFEPAKLFKAITGMNAIPASEIEKVIPALETLWYQCDKDVDRLTVTLQPYFANWAKRRGKNGAYYSKSNCSWLYDWAIAGQIPGEGAEPANMRKLRGADGEIIEVPA